jgi:serine/threonine-protein kinase
MSTLARRAEAIPLMAVMTTLSHHAKGSGPREKAALRTMKWMIDANRLAPIANLVLTGPPHQKDAARQLLVLAGSVGVGALYAAREQSQDPASRQTFVQIMHEAGPAAWTFMAQALPRIEVSGDQELALVEDLLRAMPDRPDPMLGDAVARFLPHAQLRQIALQVIVPLWGERAKKPLVEALEHADEPTRVIALNELRRLHAIDDYVFSILERFLTMRGSAGEELRVAAALALADVSAPLRTRAIQMLVKTVEGKRGLVALIRGSGDNDETPVVLEAMARALLALDRNEGVKALKGRVSRSEGATKQRLAALLQSSG